MNIRQNDSYKAYMFAMQHANRSFPAAGWEAAGTISWGRLKRCKEPAWVSPGIWWLSAVAAVTAFVVVPSYRWSAWACS